LKGLGLIPRTPLPSPSPDREVANEADDANGGSVHEMTREELAAEVLRWRNSQKNSKAEKVEQKVDKKIEMKVEKQIAVKRERSESGSAGPSTMVPKKRKKAKVIDLTGDSD
jgi:hypothetical protein